MRGHPAVIVVAVWASALVSCPLPIYPLDFGPPTDATRDTNVIDATDPPPDATFDGGPSDPGWAASEGLPAGCLIHRAQRPERLPVPAIEACGDGCSRMRLSPVWYVNDAYYTGGQVWLRMDSNEFGEFTQTTALLAAGEAISEALRFRASASVPSCRVFHTAVSDGRLGFVATWLPGDGETLADLVFTRLTADPVPASLPARIVDSPRVTLSTHTQELAVSSELVGLRTSAGDVLLLREDEIVEAYSALPPGGSAYDVSAAGDHAVFSETGAAWRLLHWTPETGTEVYWDPVDDVGIPRLYGDTLVWAQFMDFVDGTATRAELWTAEFVRDPAELRPRMVHRDVQPNYAQFADGVFGWYLTPDGGFEIRIVDLDTGRERSIRPPVGVRCSDLLYVSRRDVGASCSAVGGRFLYRFDPEVLAVDVSP